MSKARRIEIACPGIDSHVLQIKVRAYRGESDVTKPSLYDHESKTTSRRCFRLPLLLNHLQEITMIDYAFKDGSKSKAVMPTESRGKTNNRYFAREGRRIDIDASVPYFWVEIRQKSTISALDTS